MTVKHIVKRNEITVIFGRREKPFGSLYHIQDRFINILLMVTPGMSPKWYPITYGSWSIVVHYIGSWSIVVHYIGNRALV